jgi:hypothetical protein
LFGIGNLSFNNQGNRSFELKNHTLPTIVTGVEGSLPSIRISFNKSRRREKAKANFHALFHLAEAFDDRSIEPRAHEAPRPF